MESSRINFPSVPSDPIPRSIEELRKEIEKDGSGDDDDGELYDSGFAEEIEEFADSIRKESRGCKEHF